MNENLTMDSAKQHIEEIRKERFWIGVGKNPLRKTVLRAVKHLSAELYSKDVHFLMELIQNAEDNEYSDGVEPSLEFMITAQDITATGAPATLLIFNNEQGFSRKNMESICDVGDSTKAGNRKRGYIGEKGIGFKSVFLLTAQPYIFSNGYQIRFSETPCPECDIAYIVPEWVDSKPSVSDIQEIYGHSSTLPTTTLILPLKPNKVKAVKEQLSNLHPELLLFLSKIKRLSVKEDNMDQNLKTIHSVSISSERDIVEKKSIDAESYTVHLTAADGDNPEGECIYYMWRQRFPVKQENKVERRMDVDEWSITLAFPCGKRLNRGMTSVGIYAFLPTEVETDLPFIIQADFLLPSSRETILWDDVWNQGILHCVPNAFINAFVSLVKTREDAPASSLASMFHFLPINTSRHPKLDVIRESIRAKLLQENIIPSESHSTQKFFHKPQEVGRLMPTFWNILLKAKRQGAKLHNLSSLGKHILNSSFDADEYNAVLNFLGIEFVDIKWYPMCIQSCNLVLGVGEDVYVELLRFLAVNWSSHFEGTAVRHIPLLKYVDAAGNVSLLSIREAQTQYTLCRSECAQHISWLIDWSKEFRSAGNLVFLPEKTQEFFVNMDFVSSWLRDYEIVKILNVYGYASLLRKSLGSNRTLVLDFAYFLSLSFSKGFISESKGKRLCSEMPVLNSYGGVTMKWKGVLVPANGSNWVELMGSNPWREEDFVELAEEYLHPGQYAGQSVPKGTLINFLRSCACASDIPDICPPDAPFSTVSGPLTKQNAFLLLEWIMKLRSRRVDIPSKFLSSIKNGSWLKVTIGGFTEYKPPSESFLPSSSWGSLVQSGSDMVDIPLVDERFYGNKISQYEEELKAIGVLSDCGQACEFIGKHLMSLATNYNLTATKVVAMLNFIKFLREKYLPVDKFINTIKKVKWVRTSCGERLPAESVLYDGGWEAASAISKVPFLDQGYYGNDILNYKTELDLLGVLVSFKGNYDMVINFLKPSASLNYLGAEPLLLALKCIRNTYESGKVVTSLKNAKCLKTNDGYMNPGQCFLFDHEWGCILEVFEGFPFVDVGFYGSEILDYRYELGQLGVVVDLDAAGKAFCNDFKRRASSKSIIKNHVLSFLTCYKKLRSSQPQLAAKFRECVREAKWLRTRVADFRSPEDCILYGADWQSISRITVLPFVDDGDKWYGNSIHEFRDELENLGVLVHFEKGSKLVFEHIFFPQDPADITPDSVISLLKCIKNFTTEGQKSLPETFLKRINQTRWLKTTVGYKSPKECLLFDSKLRSSLQRQDGLFIDEDYYGAAMSSFKKEIDAIGVIVDMRSSDATSLLAHHIKSQSEFARIVRIYDYLRECDWRPDDGAQKRVWVPTSLSDGMWVNPEECVLHDDHGLFNSLLHILDEHYEQKLLTFFWEAFEVRRSPSTNDYCMLWMEWGNTRPVVSHDECCAFWGHVIWHWNAKTEEMISESVAKVPAVSPAFDDVHLVNKWDVFLPDDLLLKDLFGRSSQDPLFVWCPVKNIRSIPQAKLHDVYAKIGVRKMSKSVSIYEVSASKCGELKRVKANDAYIVKGLVMLILGFLGDPSLNIEVKDRHETVKLLLNVTVLETPEPITVSYSLKMGSGKVVKVSTSQMVRWERENSEFFTQKLEKSGGQRSVIEYATRFSEAIAQGLFWEKEDQINRLAELIKVGFLMGFDEDAVDYFMKSKNMQISLEDEEFLASAFPSC
ncbi:hypothetical protein Cgig2_028074 [Carnegiea gigantea]|uniref:Sacsin/Nov domain-containing protein n=1 Tax=Carnegiea gigantea TaxID=171969 RepID=A0A9Q1GJH8_9CARY|nr:hypothetical protein Cgig2_028074 [Carnegiea gigantea]